MKTLSILAPLALALALAACEEKSSAPQATVTTAQPVASATAPAASASNATTTAAAAPGAATTSAAKYAISSDTSKIEWTGAKITGRHDGSFKKFSGAIELPASGKVEEGKVTLDIDAASLTTDQEKLVTHLKSPDFFDVAKFTAVKFTSTSVTPLASAGAAGATHTITGNLELHGVTKSISFPAKISVVGDAVSATSEFQINRQDFGLKYPGKPDDLIKDNVTVRLDVKAKKAS